MNEADTTVVTEKSENQTVVTDNQTVVTPPPTSDPTPVAQVSFNDRYVKPAIAYIRKTLAGLEAKIQPWKNEIWAAYLVFLAALLAIFAPKTTIAALGVVVLASGWIAYYGLRKRVKNGGQ